MHVNGLCDPSSDSDIKDKLKVIAYSDKWTPIGGGYLVFPEPGVYFINLVW